MTETIEEIVARHTSGGRIVDTIEAAYARIEAHADPALFIALRPKADALAEAAALDAAGAAGRPLFGVPFAVKDNIDFAGLPTTAACPAFSYEPARSSFVVERLQAAGAIVVGKTNLDQFATGLVGVRSPYGVPRNALRAELIPGGSSSGSATAVAAGLVPFALGTDTAGSGRVPAALNGIVGLKPTLGSLSASATTRRTPIRGRFPNRGSPRRRRIFASARHGQGSGSFSATRKRSAPSRPISNGSRLLALQSWNSISRRSSRSRGCSMRDPGSPSATPRPSG
jgi:Asp-tRNA(Asn)/Glu-tRNA(Gln) amidotransferase A subunit family amidase